MLIIITAIILDTGSGPGVIIELNSGVGEEKADFGDQMRRGQNVNKEVGGAVETIVLVLRYLGSGFCFRFPASRVAMRG